MLVLTKTVEELVEKAELKVGAAKDLPIVERDSWDGPRAKKNIFDFADFDTDNPKLAKARRGFLIYDSENPDLKGSYKLPFADVEDGKLVAVDRGLRAAASRLPQTDAPEAVKNRARRILDSYFERMDEDGDKSSNQYDLIRKSGHMSTLKLIFDADVFDVESAMAWASAHGFNVPERAPEKKGGEIILVQNALHDFDPESFIDNQITEGVVAVIGETMGEKKEVVLNFTIKSTFEKKDDDGPHTFTAFATTFGNVDLDGDVIMEGAVDESIRKVLATGKFPKILKDHDRTQRPAVMTSIIANDKGVLIEGKFLDTQLGRDTFIEVRDGAITDVSMGFNLEPDGISFRDGKHFISQLEFKEVSFVTFPANEEANIISVKNKEPNKFTSYPKPDSVRQFEKLLRDAGGFSKKEATTIASVGFRESKERDVRLIQSIVDNLKNTTEEMRIKHGTNLKNDKGSTGGSLKDPPPV